MLLLMGGTVACMWQPDSGMTPLLLACKLGHERIVNLLLSRNANVLAVDVRTPRWRLPECMHGLDEGIVCAEAACVAWSFRVAPAARRYRPCGVPRVRVLHRPLGGTRCTGRCYTAACLWWRRSCPHRGTPLSIKQMYVVSLRVNRAGCPPGCERLSQYLSNCPTALSCAADERVHATVSCCGLRPCVTLWSTCVVVCHCVAAVVARRVETQLTHTAAELADWYGHREILRLLEEKMDTSAGTATPSTAPTDGLAQLAIGSHTAGEGSFHDNSSTAAATASAAAATAAAAAASTAAAAVSAPGSTTQVAAATAPQSAGASAASTPVAPAVPPSSVSTYL